MEKNKTGLEWFESKYVEMYEMQGSVSPKYTMFLIEQAKQMEKREMILLLNWILKHFETHTDSNYMFCWKSPSGQELDSVHLVEQYIKETYGE